MFRYLFLALLIYPCATAAPLTIVTAQIPNAAVGKSFYFTFQASGGNPPYRWSNPLIDGAAMDSTGVLQGTPRSAQVVTLPISVTDSSGATASKNFQWVIAGPLVIHDNGALIQMSLGAYSSYQLAIDSLASAVITVRRLPQGVQLTTQSLGSVMVASIAGSPSEPGDFNVGLGLTGVLGDTATAYYNVHIIGVPLRLNIEPSYTLRVGESKSILWGLSGGLAPVQLTVSGSVPDGMTVNSGGISGTPSRPGTYSLTVKAADAAGAVTTASTVILVTAPLALGAAALPPARNNNPYSAALSATGGSPPYSWTASGNLPAGLGLSAAGVLSGTVTVPPGDYPLRLIVKDSGGASTTVTVNLTVTGPLLTPQTLPNARAGTPYAQTLGLKGGTPPFTWSMAGGRLPAGILFDSSIGAIAGAPSEPGFFSFTMEVFDIYRSISSATFRMTVDAAPLTIAAAPALPAGNVGAAYQATLAASGGTPPYQFAIESGAAPDGTTLSPAGVLSGVPKQKGTFTFVARATDAASQVARVAVVVQVLGAIPSFTSASVLNGASFRPGIAPGGYISIFGTNLAAATAIAPDLPLPAAAGGVSVQWNGVALPLLSVSPGQINAQVPFDAAPGRGELTVTADGVTSSKVAVEAQAASPGLFEASPGSLLAINADGRLNAADQGAVAGTIIVFYATGGGPYDAPLHAGQATPIDRLYRLTQPCSVTIGGAPAEILFAGAAPALGSGLVQLNVRVPDLSPGTWPVVLKIGETSSNTPALSVTAHP